MPFKAPVELTKAELHWTVGPAANGKWQSKAATIDGNRIQASLPADRPLTYFLTVTDKRKATVSTEHATVEKKK